MDWKNIGTIKRRFTESGRPPPKKNVNIAISEEKINIGNFFATLSIYIYRGGFTCCAEVQAVKINCIDSYAEWRKKYENETT